MFHTDWLAVLVIGLYVVIPALVIWLVVRRDPAVPTLKRRPSDPQLGAAEGTGVERGPRRSAAADLAALPRSPQTPADVVAPRPAASAGLHFNPCSACTSPGQCALAGFCARGTSVHQQAVLHG